MLYLVNTKQNKVTDSIIFHGKKTLRILSQVLLSCKLIANWNKLFFSKLTWSSTFYTYNNNHISPYTGLSYI